MEQLFTQKILELYIDVLCLFLYPLESSIIIGMLNKELNENNFKVFVVTNQRGIAKGLMTKDDLHEIHKNMQSELKEIGAHIDAIYYCPHEEGECDCRKPKIGMFEQAKAELPKIQFEDSFVIGDSLKDIKAGNKIGSTTILISNPQLEQSEDEGSLANHNVSSLFKAVKK